MQWNLRGEHDGDPVDVQEGDDDGERHQSGDQGEHHEWQRDDSELKMGQK